MQRPRTRDERRLWVPLSSARATPHSSLSGREALLLSPFTAEETEAQICPSDQLLSDGRTGDTSLLSYTCPSQQSLRDLQALGAAARRPVQFSLG